MFPAPIVDYNKHMGESDGNAQQRACGSPAQQRDVRYWWSVFGFMLEACILNAFILFQLDHPKSKLTHIDFQWHCAVSLLRNQAGQSKLKKIPESTMITQAPRARARTGAFTKKKALYGLHKKSLKAQAFRADSG